MSSPTAIAERTKLCRRCGKSKPLTEFHRNQANPDGYRYPCKVCACAMQRAVGALRREQGAPLAEIEADFRVHAFRVLYGNTYADEKSNDRRFGLALVASIGPIRDRAAMLTWHRGRGGKKGAVA